MAQVPIQHSEYPDPSNQADTSPAFLQDLAIRIRENGHGEISRRAREGMEERLRMEQQQAIAEAAISYSDKPWLSSF